uniref:Uncharacterized protein n=1 Tax=Ciona intestinalis TaxID=7719 RepID=H2XRT3_CIOIN
MAEKVVEFRTQPLTAHCWEFFTSLHAVPYSSFIIAILNACEKLKQRVCNVDADVSRL